MIYFDSSAVVSFFIEDEHSSTLTQYLKNISLLVAFSSMLTPLEFDSAIQRRLNSKEINESLAEEAREGFLRFRKKIQLISFNENSLKIAAHVQRIHGLRPGDSIQLASALVCREDPSQVTFLCFDDKLNSAARKEGFNLLPLSRSFSY